MVSGKFMEAYFLAGITVALFYFASGKLNNKPTNLGLQTTDNYYDKLQRLTNDDSIAITVKQYSHKQTQFERKHREKIGRIKVKNSDSIPSKRRKSILHLFGKRQANISNRERQKLRESRNQRFSKNWYGQVKNQKHASEKVILRKSRNGKTYENDDDENILTKDEDEEENVQLIIIPRKPRKHVLPNDRSEDGENNSKTSDKIFKNSIDDSEKSNQDSENLETNSKDFEDDSKNYENFKNSRKDSEKPYKISAGSRHRFKNGFHGKKDTRVKSNDGNSNDDVTLTSERVVAEDDDNDSKNSHQSESGADDYDLHLKVKDKSGTNVKLSGDLPGNIGSLIAVGENGAKVQIENTRENARAKTSKNTKTEELEIDSIDASTDEMARDLIKLKSGKLKHSPYPPNILLKPDRGKNEKNNIEDSEENTNLTPFKYQGSDDSSSQAPNPFTSLTREEANAKADKPANQQPSNNIFSPMEFKNGDDELMATSRLLDIAQKEDDVSSLKETKDSSNTVKDSSKYLKDFTKDFAKGASEMQTSHGFVKSSSVTSEVYKTQTENIDKEASDNWYKLQSLEDRIVNDGNSAKTGKAVGSYNGQKVSVVSPSQLQLLQTEYPSYPAYLTPLLRSKIRNE